MNQIKQTFMGTVVSVLVGTGAPCLMADVLPPPTSAPVLSGVEAMDISAGMPMRFKLKQNSKNQAIKSAFSDLEENTILGPLMLGVDGFAAGTDTARYESEPGVGRWLIRGRIACSGGRELCADHVYERLLSAPNILSANFFAYSSRSISWDEALPDFYERYAPIEVWLPLQSGDLYKEKLSSFQKQVKAWDINTRKLGLSGDFYLQAIDGDVATMIQVPTSIESHSCAAFQKALTEYAETESSAFFLDVTCGRPE